MQSGDPLRLLQCVCYIFKEQEQEPADRGQGYRLACCCVGGRGHDKAVRSSDPDFARAQTRQMNER